MVKKLIIVFLLTLTLSAKDTYEKNCVKCHQDLPMSLQRMFMHYLSVYSGEQNTKAALKHFLRHPRKDTSVMSELFLQNFAVKEPLDISDKTLNEAIDIYWNKYKVISKLK
ncbi:MAG: hypothetical protein DRG30_03895 [Epsilonproteobacteria bacterium]|nr:MAG: hypothetical protein DRG30_03895 [Campylobacterota bacterium]